MMSGCIPMWCVSVVVQSSGYTLPKNEVVRPKGLTTSFLSNLVCNLQLHQHRQEKYGKCTSRVSNDAAGQRCQF